MNEEQRSGQWYLVGDSEFDCYGWRGWMIQRPSATLDTRRRYGSGWDVFHEFSILLSLFWFFIMSFTERYFSRDEFISFWTFFLSSNTVIVICAIMLSLHSSWFIQNHCTLHTIRSPVSFYSCQFLVPWRWLMFSWLVIEWSVSVSDTSDWLMGPGKLLDRRTDY